MIIFGVVKVIRQGRSRLICTVHTQCDRERVCNWKWMKCNRMKKNWSQLLAVAIFNQLNKYAFIFYFHKNTPVYVTKSIFSFGVDAFVIGVNDINHVPWMWTTMIQATNHMINDKTKTNNEPNAKENNLHSLTPWPCSIAVLCTCCCVYHR